MPKVRLYEEGNINYALVREISIKVRSVLSLIIDEYWDQVDSFDLDHLIMGEASCDLACKRISTIVKEHSR